MNIRLQPAQQQGFSLIELMVAMLLGLLLTAGVISVFISTSGDSRQQTLLATLQEDARFALARMSQDLSMGNANYCSSVGGPFQRLSAETGIEAYLRTPTINTSHFGDVLQDLTTPFGASSGGNSYPTQPNAAYSWPAYLYMRGYDCTATACTPVDPSTATPSGIPAAGTAPGSRVIGSDVLTLRYLDANRGWALDGVMSHVNTLAGQVTSITVAPRANETDTLSGGHVMMLADCNASQVFYGGLSGSDLTVNVDLNQAAVMPVSGLAPKLFDLNQDLRNISYYLQVVADSSGHTTGALMRRANGDTHAAELVRGVERLDFSYGVLSPSGGLQYLSAAQVDQVNQCPAVERFPLASTPGCLWRFVQSIRVDILMDGETPLYSLPAAMQKYAYLPDQANTPIAPEKHLLSPVDQGFPLPMLRRAFSITVALRNVNP